MLGDWEGGGGVDGGGGLLGVRCCGMLCDTVFDVAGYVFWGLVRENRDPGSFALVMWIFKRAMVVGIFGWRA